MSDLWILGGGELPFSKGVLAQALMAVGLPAQRAYLLAVAVEDDLALSGERSIDLERFEELAGAALGEEEGRRAVLALRRDDLLARLGQPLVLLVGGATGSGKSTVATEVAHRLGIIRVTSTDFIRHTMRALFSREFMPSIHFSSFEAGRAIAADESEIPVVPGFFEQTRYVRVGVQALVERAIQERWSLVLEGVHLVPGMLHPVEGALVVHCVLYIESEEEHASHFWVRDAVSDGVRPMKRYLDALPEIRAIQAAIVERAERTGVPVIENSDIERTIGSVMELVLAQVEGLERV